MACTDMAICLEVDGLAAGSSASTMSRSLELLLVLHTLLGAAVLQRTNERSRLEWASAEGVSSVGRLAMLEHCQAPRSSPRRPTSSRSTVPRCRRTSRRLRDVPSSRFTRHRPSGATLQRRFGGSASNAPREQPTGNLDGRRVKCSTMMAAALHGQNENYPPTHIPKSTCT